MSRRIRSDESGSWPETERLLLRKRRKRDARNKSKFKSRCKRTLMSVLRKKKRNRKSRKQRIRNRSL